MTWITHILTRYRMVLVPFIAAAIVIINVNVASAATPFFDLSIPGTPDNGSRYGSGSVISGGVPSWVGDKASLMSWLKSTYYSAPSGNYNPPYWNQTGIAYFVRLLLGDGRSYTVSDADFAKLDKLLQPSNGVTIKFNVSEKGSSDTYICQHEVPRSGRDPYDVCKYDHDWNGEAIVVEQKINGVTKVIAKVQRVCFNPDGNSPGGLVTIPDDYSLTPLISSSDSSAVAGAKVDLTPSVKNSKSGPSNNTQWQVSQFRPLIAYPGAGNSSQAPSPYYKNVITNVSSGTGASYPAKATTPLTVVSVVVPDLPVGSLVCYAFSVQARANDSGEWAHSEPVCIKVAVKPLVQVWGGDLSAGKSFLGTSVAVPAANIETSTSTKTIAGTNYTFGAWVEYGIFATGTIKNIASAAAYAGTGATQGLTNSSLCKSTYLSFNNASGGQNVCTGGAYKTVGTYTTTRSIPDVASNYPITSGTPQFGSKDINSGATQGLYTSSSDITLAGGTIGAGRWIVINAPNANVTITGNITYTSAALSSVSDIPQMVIIAKNINILDAVTQIDAWLIAKPSAALADGVINTCSSVSLLTQLSSAICPKPLVVNGPVMANKLYLRRTTGPGTGVASGNPAETFNLRADAYLWAYAHTTSNGRVQTVYTTELPPRL